MGGGALPMEQWVQGLRLQQATDPDGRCGSAGAAAGEVIGTQRRRFAVAVTFQPQNRQKRRTAQSETPGTHKQNSLVQKYD